MKKSNLFLYFFLILLQPLVAGQSPVLLPSTEGDPDSFIDDRVNVIDGDYCETVIDLTIRGPDPLYLQRFYNAKNYVTGAPYGGWRIFSYHFMVIGKEKNQERNLAFTGARSGSILTYSRKDCTNDLFKIDIEQDGRGLVNTFSKDISGKTNRSNHALYYYDTLCELFLGDGTKRIYEKADIPSTKILGEELLPILAEKIEAAQYYHLIEEVLPSGNRLLFTYNVENHLSKIELVNKLKSKTISWIHFDYQWSSFGCLLTISTSDEKTIEYNLSSKGKDLFTIDNVFGSHIISVSYEYECDGDFFRLIKKVLPFSGFSEILYDQNGRVKALLEPHPVSGEPIKKFELQYSNNYTDVFNDSGIKTRYKYNESLELTETERYDKNNNLYSIKQKFWGENENKGRLIATAAYDQNQVVNSLRSLSYDKWGNVVKDMLFGNLTIVGNMPISIDSNGRILNPETVECYTLQKEFSQDGYNLLLRAGDTSRGFKIYKYKTNSNLLLAEFFYEGAENEKKAQIRKRIFHFYDDDGAKIKTIEDDGCHENSTSLLSVTERHIITFQPKKYLPGVGLPEIIEEKALDLLNQIEILLKRHIIEYDFQGNPINSEVYDSEGNFSYSEKRSFNNLNLLSRETDRFGKQIFYSYDALGNLTSVNYHHLNKITEYHYDYNSNRTAALQKINNDTLISSDSFNSSNKKISSTDFLNNTTFYEYDEFDRLTKIVFPEVLNENEKAITPTCSYSYDAFNNVISITDPNGYITCKSYNIRNQLTKIIFPDGTLELFKYDLGGTLYRTLSRNRTGKSFSYDYQGRVIIEQDMTWEEDNRPLTIGSCTYKYNAFGLTESNNQGLITSYEKDYFGRPDKIQLMKSETDKSKTRCTEIGYDSMGRPNRKKIWYGTRDYEYTTQCYEYDIADNIIEKWTEDAYGQKFFHQTFNFNEENGTNKEYEYINEKKELVSQTIYDNLGEPIANLDSNGNKTKIKVNNSFINDLGQRVIKKTIINASGAQSEIEFDALGRISIIQKNDSKGALLSHQHLLYDAAGNKCKEINLRLIEGNTYEQVVNKWIYGPLGRIEEEIENEGLPNECVSQYQYNEYGQQIKKTTPGFNNPLIYNYDFTGKIAEILYQSDDKKNEPEINYRIKYDSTGNVLETRFGRYGRIKRDYDIFGQVIKELVVDCEKGAYTINYQYDRIGRITSIILPDKSKINYAYNAVSATEIERYSSNNELLYTHCYISFDEKGEILQESSINDISVEHLYNCRGQLTKIHSAHLDSSGQYDDFGRLKLLTNKINDKPSISNFEYNDLSQLTSESGFFNNKYGYDSLDNKLQINDEPLHYHSNQLLSFNSSTYSYDKKGNLTEKITNQEKTKFKTNCLSQLVQIEKNDKSIVNLIYDPFGRRLTKKIMNGPGTWAKLLSLEHFIYIGNQEIGCLDKNGRIQELRIPGIENGEISTKNVAIEIGGKPYIPLYDIMGNISAIIDSDNNKIVESYLFSAFGKEIILNSNGDLIENSLIGNPWLYRGKRLDKESGLLFFGIRYYDPEIGRWTNPDPLGTLDGPNPYAYVHNNPLNCIDRFGLQTESGWEGRERVCPYHDRQCYYIVLGPPGNRYALGCWPRPQADNISKLPKITYFDEFEVLLNNDDSSRIFKLGLEDRYNLGIGYINGILNSLEDSQKSAHYISRLADGINVHAVYNVTHGLKMDLAECKMGLDFCATTPVRLLHQTWDNFFKTASSTALFLQICHSQGSIHVRNALLDYPPDLRNRIMVVAIAPAGYIYQETCAKVIHYRVEASRDLVPRFDKTGASMVQRQGTVKDLTSHPNADLFDHNFESPTYRDVLGKHLAKYVNSKGEGI